ncbi:hypothetical protein CPB84DRAFT_1772583 [Gymnopilus junonius]|uniref:Uncharacterized protein n=1 Tax=Gymnopilus junonius TaxID=109634 RepID=A0A9P5TP41_GYMJU|nr:hypothetical protein CPB84DRAFT_1772583 [Gymnopilus junonius]
MSALSLCTAHKRLYGLSYTMAIRGVNCLLTPRPILTLQLRDKAFAPMGYRYMSLLDWKSRTASVKNQRWDCKDVPKLVFIPSGLACSLASWVLAGLIVAWLKKLPEADVHPVTHGLKSTAVLALGIVMAAVLFGGILIISLCDSDGAWATSMKILVPLTNVICYIYFAAATSWSPAKYILDLQLSQPVSPGRLASINHFILALNALTTVNAAFCVL